MSIIKNTEELNNLLEVVQKLPVKKDEQEKTVDITESGTMVVTPDEGMTLNKVVINTSVKAEENWNEFLNKWGADSYELLDTLIYTQDKIAGSGKFLGLKANKVFITQAKKIPQETFSSANFNLVWFGDLSLDSSSQGKLELKDAAFHNNQNLQHIVINFEGTPLEVLSLEQDNVFMATLIENGFGILYVPENMVSQWQEAIDNYEITNFNYYMEVKPISSLFEEGGPLYDTVLPSE